MKCKICFRGASLILLLLMFWFVPSVSAEDFAPIVYHGAGRLGISGKLHSDRPLDPKNGGLVEIICERPLGCAVTFAYVEKGVLHSGLHVLPVDWADTLVGGDEDCSVLIHPETNVVLVTIEGKQYHARLLK